MTVSTIPDEETGWSTVPSTRPGVTGTVGIGLVLGSVVAVVGVVEVVSVVEVDAPTDVDVANATVAPWATLALREAVIRIPRSA